MQGIDVSRWQRGFDFEEAKRQGKEFCIVRIGTSSYDTHEPESDDQFFENINGAKDAGMELGIYFYSTALTMEQAQKEAEWVNAQLKGCLRNTELKAGIWLDYEDDTQRDNRSPGENTAVAMAWVNRMNSYGWYVGIYSYYSFFTNNLIVNNIPNYVPLWVSQIYHENSLQVDYPNRNIPIWQYDTSAHIGGIEVDLDYKE